MSALLRAGVGPVIVMVAGLLPGQVIQTIPGSFSGGAGTTAGLYGINAGDIDGDGIDEVLLVAARAGNYGPTFQIYSAARQMVLASRQVSYLYSPAVGNRDIDGDGIPDFACYAAGGWGCVAFSGATLAPIWAFSPPNNTGGTYTMALLDGNDDGYCDIAIGVPYGPSARNTQGYVRLYSGRDGSMLWENSFSSGMGYSLQRLDDIDGDGIEDLVAGRSSTDLVVAISGRTGTTLWFLFDPVNFPRPIYVTDRAGDVNRDGADDILLWSPNDSTLGAVIGGRRRVLSGRDGAVLQDHFGNIPYGAYGAAILGDDWDLDGVRDHVVRTERPIPSPLGWVLEIVSGATGAVLQTYIGPPNEPLGMAAGGDFNGDGTTDLLWNSAYRTTACGICGGVDVYQVRAGPAGHWRPRGHGCPGSDLRLPTSAVRGYPRLGTVMAVNLRAALSHSWAFLVVGSAGGTDLGPLGAPGCRLNVSPFWWELLPTSAQGRSEKGFAVPLDPALSGIRFDATWMVLDGQANALGVTAATGLSVVLGM